MAARRILWTGGFDSTWLVVDALLAGDRVETFAWTGGSRLVVPDGKAEHEGQARDSIAGRLPVALRSRLTSVTFRDSQIDNLFRPLWDEMLAAAPGRWWSPQNYVLAALPAVLGPVEAGLVADDGTAGEPGIVEILRREGVAVPIVGRSKLELLADAESRGFAGLLDATWSCEWAEPLEPACGTCDSCRLRASTRRRRVSARLRAAADACAPPLHASANH